ncbi:hypothetical protein HYY71_01045 [Candidatus Woesearchaeota archaeon]|nr:hypothetical protein [Candidatus Woesearchaeota archaeon]
MEENQTAKIIWWKDKKLLAGIILVISSLIVGFYGKGLIIVKFYEPFSLITGLSIWAFSWILLFIGVFLVGWETVRMIQQRVQSHVKETVKGTYHYTKGLSKKGYHYTKEIHRKGLGRIKQSLK